MTRGAQNAGDCAWARDTPTEDVKAMMLDDAGDVGCNSGQWNFQGEFGHNDAGDARTHDRAQGKGK